LCFFLLGTELNITSLITFGRDMREVNTTELVEGGRAGYLLAKWATGYTTHVVVMFTCTWFIGGRTLDMTWYCPL
jgi:hypothetical protein